MGKNQSDDQMLHSPFLPTAISSYELLFEGDFFAGLFDDDDLDVQEACLEPMKQQGLAADQPLLEMNAPLATSGVAEIYESARKRIRSILGFDDDGSDDDEDDMQRQRAAGILIGKVDG